MSDDAPKSFEEEREWTEERAPDWQFAAECYRAAEALARVDPTFDLQRETGPLVESLVASIRSFPAAAEEIRDFVWFETSCGEMSSALLSRVADRLGSSL